MKLLPYSEYMVLAKRGETDIIVKYYGSQKLADRVIVTDYNQIVDLKIGRKEKLLYIVDQGHDILTEYYLPEMKCPKIAGVVGCNEYFLDQDIKCADSTTMYYNEKERGCVCRAGYYRDQAS